MALSKIPNNQRQPPWTCDQPDQSDKPQVLSVGPHGRARSGAGQFTLQNRPCDYFAHPCLRAGLLPAHSAPSFWDAGRLHGQHKPMTSDGCGQAIGCEGQQHTGPWDNPDQPYSDQVHC
uniref:Uncharacterized protein n=1 Tax=Eutreptiella gymnastica TaxID=73025 RepID=A0A7S1NDE3_9EUGL